MDKTTLEQDRIEHGIAQTRSRMDARLGALQERLSPGQVLDDLTAYFRGSEGAEFGRNLLDSVKRHPLPVALTGIGLTWLAVASAQRQNLGVPSGAAKRSGTVTSTGFGPGGSWREVEEFDYQLRAAEAELVRHPGEDEIAHRGRLDEARARVVGIVRQAQETSESFASRVQAGIAATREKLAQAAQTAADNARDTAEQLVVAAQSTGDQVAGRAQAARRIGSNLFSAMGESPFLLGAAGLAVGALIGALVPQSDAEEGALSGIAGQVRGAASDLAQQAVDRGSRAAQSVLESGRDSARAHGVSTDMSVAELARKAGSGELVGAVRNVARDVLQAGEEAVRNEAPSVKTTPAAAPQPSAAPPRPTGPASTSRP